MAHDWLLVETLGTEPVVVAHGVETKDMVPISTYLRRDPGLMAIQTAIGETVRGGQPLSSITPKHDRVIRTEVVQMTDGVIHGVHVWTGPPDAQPPERALPGPLKWDLTNRIATDTPESLFNGGRDPSVEATHGRAFAEDLPTRDLNAREAHALSAAIKPEPGIVYCTTWDLTDHRGEPITVGFVARIMQESDGGPDVTICRAMNWRTVRDENTVTPAGLAQDVLDGSAQPGVHRALVDLQSWALLKWLDDPCPFYDWRARSDDAPLTHPGDADEIAGMTAEFENAGTSRVLRLRANGGGWVPIHVTIHRIELDGGVWAGLLSLRLPTEHELAGFAARTRPWRAALPGGAART